ncbi:ATP-grasp domain-containing protein [Actinokineospora cianjurensis]|uniref:ATP-grasp domain-containing protein n=1 Tax=Actinokineospora cianjurensis TaxID=585224 RepID=A0A421B1D7_9PSEU|nr:ATP-grasp domain-containing protein [Actinokineospora cianjurensis]RLK58093.1 ATP-grasp domain-containing protein [Actinokineospora cianjurensis]
MGERPLMILVGIGYEPHRGYLLRSIAATTDVWLLDHSALSWEEPYVVGGTAVDIRDGAALLAAAREVADGRTVDGILCWDELKMANTAVVAQHLGLPGVSPDVIDRCRDKHRTRGALAAAGVPQPRSVAVSSLAQAESVAADIGYPVILKPRALGASMGVTKVDSPGALPAAYEHTRAQHVDQARYYELGVLVEEYASGPEFSVDCAVVDGATTPLFLARKTSGFAPYFEETGHLVDGADPLFADPELRAILSAAHTALEFDSGMTHTELRLTPRGWSVIEVNCRLGGDLIPYLGLESTGIDAGRVAAAIACGRPPVLTPTHKTVTAIRFLYPTTPTTVADIHIDTTALPRGTLLATPLATPGTTLAPPPEGHVWGRYAMTAITAPTPAACPPLLDTAEAAITLIPA